MLLSVHQLDECSKDHLCNSVDECDMAMKF